MIGNEFLMAKYIYIYICLLFLSLVLFKFVEVNVVELEISHIEWVSFSIVPPKPTERTF